MKFVNGWAVPDWDEFVGPRIDKNGGYQRSHLNAALARVTKWDLAVDGGGHIGTWSKPMAERFAKVVTFEPSADSFACLARNLAGIGNVQLRHQALGATPGRARMTLEGHDRAIELKNTAALFVRPGDDVEVITLDSLELPALDFFKLDVEGSEVVALQGAEQTLRKYRPLILYEDKGLWKRYGYKRNAVAIFLDTLGARHLERVSMDEIWGW